MDAEHPGKDYCRYFGHYANYLTRMSSDANAKPPRIPGSLSAEMAKRARSAVVAIRLRLKAQECKKF